MKMRSDRCSAAILCGGKSNRMGQDKARLVTDFCGDRVKSSFLGGLAANLSSFDDLWLSIGSGESYPEINVRKVSDRFSGSGPMGGLESILNVCRHDLVFITPVDMPFVDSRLADELLDFYEQSCPDAMLIIDGNGRRQPLLGIYRKALGPKLTQYMQSVLHEKKKEDYSFKNRNYRIKDFLEHIETMYVPAELLTDGLHKTLSCNTMEEYERLLSHRPTGTVDLPDFDYRSSPGEIPILSVTGWSGSGKTTFIERLIPLLKEKGISIACIKHDAHHFEIDKEGKDSFRISKAGAVMTGLLSSQKGVWMENRSISLEEMIRFVHDVDLILLEGGSSTPYPKILIYREELGKDMRVDPEKCLAVVSDRPLPGQIRQFRFEEMDKVVNLITDYLKRKEK